MSRGRGAIGLLVVVLLAAGCRHDDGSSASSKGAGSAGCRPGESSGLRGVRRDLQVGSEMRSYLLDVPPGPSDEPRPLILAFHGFRAAPGRLRRWTGLARGAQRGGAIVAFPEGHDGVELLGVTGRGWDFELGQTRDLSFVTGLLDTLEREWCIDRRRIYATGMSNGGFFANLLGCALGDRLAAVAPVAGATPLPGCQHPQPLPVLLIQGAADKVVDPAKTRAARDWWAQTNRCKGDRSEGRCTFGTECAADVTYCEGPQGHVWPRPATRRILGFFEAHARP
jgi:polyhydroxybutyrate depolymerase